MTRIVVGDDFVAGLNNPLGLVEVCDASGRTLGYFHPVIPAGVAAKEGLEPPFSEEEIERRRKEPGGRPLAEILADLDKR